jgi:hypothetical protein
LLGSSTLLIAILLAALYRRERDMGVVAGFAALYYWSLYGGWSLVVDKLGGSSGQHYHYLEYKMFPVALDGRYLITLAVYAVFIVAAQLTMLAVLPVRRQASVPRLIFRHEPILLLGFFAGIASYLLVREKLSVAWTLNTSAYWYTRAQTGPWFTAHQILNRVALIPPSIGFATLVAGARSRYFVSVPTRFTFLGYLLLFAGMGTFTFVLGNKNEVFTALLTGMLAYLGSLARPDWRKVGLVLLAGLWYLTAVDFFRGTPLSQIGEVVRARYEESTNIGHFVTTSDEAFAAHFSMYGALAANIEPNFGYSFYSLACSIVPRALWPERPKDIYYYYAEHVGAIQNQGYSIHHATGWYLNFGYPGVVLGAVVLGLVWSSVLKARHNIRRSSGLAYRLFAAIGPWVFAAGLPPLIRAGPEAYKGLVLDCLLIPIGILFFACRHRKQSKKKLLWRAQHGWVLEGRLGA